MSTGISADETVATTAAVSSEATSTTTSGGTTAASSAISTSGGTTLVLDIGSTKDVGDGIPEGCEGKIDLLFVISRDNTLPVIQSQLVDAFPKFVSTIASKFDDFDYHIMVVDTDAYWGNPWQCTPVCPDLSCKEGDPCCPYDQYKGDPCCPDPNYPCDDLNLVTACDETLGAGVIFPAGRDASDEPCKMDGGRRYLTKYQSNLSETFACVAQVGTGGGNQVGAALAAAVAPEINAPGGCNDGFLRDDALLMVTMVTPGSDDSFTGSVPEWYEAVVTAKHGDSGAVVMFVIGDDACPYWDQPCELAEMFPYHHVVDGLAEDYGPAFSAASSLVVTACEKLVPG